MVKALHNIGGFGPAGDDGNGRVFDGTEDNNQQQQQQQQGQLVGVEGEEGEDETDSDLDEILKSFGPNEEDDDDDENDSNDQVHRQEQTENQSRALEADIRKSITNMRIPDDLIPEDFDPSDRTQFAKVLQSTLQATVAQSLNVVFKPVQFAMQQMATEINSSIDQRITQARDGISEQSLMEQQIPEAANPKYAPMIQSMNNTLKANGKKPTERVKAIRKILNQMGIKDSSTQSNPNRRSTGGQDDGASLRTGKAALDSIFGAPFPNAKK